jgi:hypothetical protein
MVGLCHTFWLCGRQLTAEISLPGASLEEGRSYQRGPRWETWSDLEGQRFSRQKRPISLTLAEEQEVV